MMAGDDICRLDNSRVLIIDDDEMNHEIVTFFLNEIGITKIYSAFDGVEGLDLVEQQQPHLVVLDVIMPRKDGMEVLRDLRQKPQYAQLPVIVLTGNDTSESRESMFQVGATDFVTKPLLAQEFQARVKTHLKNLLLVQRLETQLESIANEMQTAAELQHSMLPQRSVTELIREKYGISVMAMFEPSSALGGDFYGLTPLNDRSFGYYMCDFAGHGVGAALNTVRLHTMIGRLPPPDPCDPASYLAALNGALFDTLTRRHYATFLYGVVDVVDHTFTYSAAGAPPPLLMSNGKALEWLDSRGMPLGLVKHAPYHNLQVPFGPGSRMFLYSDVMIESHGRNGTLFGPDELSDLVVEVLGKETGNRRMTEIVSRFMHQVHQPLDDDLTALFVEWPA